AAPAGPDDANHDWDGIFILNDGEKRRSYELQGLEIRDVAPTILDLFEMEIPWDMEGRSILKQFPLIFKSARM
ncbi:MAG: hypothetical protein NC930_07520, partial [Candidatus Omnitrophica bacterium]|nr:hypothetical protein [Candidatus Omnitrophota bacterium]